MYARCRVFSIFMEIINLLIAFNLGLFSILHCLGMCGGIIGALTLATGNQTGRKTIHLYIIQFAYNFGRILSYTLAGAIAGVISQYFLISVSPGAGHQLLRVLAGLILIIIGLNLTGVIPKINILERLGYLVWKKIQPFSSHFLPVKNPGNALFIGMIWGWLPCALVYSVLLWALTTGDVLDGAAIMFVFGLGTLPGVLSAGIMSSSLVEIFRKKQSRILAGAVIITIGVISPFIPFDHTLHQQHQHLHG